MHKFIYRGPDPCPPDAPVPSPVPLAQHWPCAPLRGSPSVQTPSRTGAPCPPTQPHSPSTRADRARAGGQGPSPYVRGAAAMAGRIPHKVRQRVPGQHMVRGTKHGLTEPTFPGQLKGPVAQALGHDALDAVKHAAP